MDVERWLEQLGLQRDAYRVLALLPLVYVAWADGRVQSAERRRILEIADKHGLLEHGGTDALERWLANPPTGTQLCKDLAALHELARGDKRWAEHFGPDDEQLLLAWCQDVADAAGGMLGLRSPRTDAELYALKTVAAALDLRSADPNWRDALSPARTTG